MRSTMSGDVVFEAVEAGVDLVTSFVSFVLGAEVENLTLAGSADIDGTGNDLDNALRGQFRREQAFRQRRRRPASTAGKETTG